MHTLSSFSKSPALLDTLRSAVERSKLSKQDIAAKAGISRRALYALLGGEADPRLSTLEALAHVLGLDLLAAPKAANAVRFAEPSSAQRSAHSRVRRLLEQAGHAVAER